MFTVRYGDERHASNAARDGAVQVSKPDPIARVAEL
jgi:hypothetical protein